METQMKTPRSGVPRLTEFLQEPGVATINYRLLDHEHQVAALDRRRAREDDADNDAGDR